MKKREKKTEKAKQSMMRSEEFHRQCRLLSLSALKKHFPVCEETKMRAERYLLVDVSAGFGELAAADVEVNASQLSCSARRIRRRLVSTKSFSRRKRFTWFGVLLLDDQQLLERCVLEFRVRPAARIFAFRGQNQQMVERPVDGSSADLRYATSFGLVAATPFWVVFKRRSLSLLLEAADSSRGGIIFKDLVFVVDYQFPYLEIFSSLSFSVFSTLVTVHRELLR
ncbi:hypothetical protein F511_12338 [Dorcoceras hygrometricum]|uniref:Uncharacterized protein n=1 Tax=Dorcoceras hygrometricum TaxID=472368 RepID=A0A2Z7BJU9_9LAMI|nr:hypothetical protein F511_12338 [Dorcoceras hygrometricum]